MKHMKKIASFVLAAIMVLAMVVPTFAATVDNKTTHPYKAYQVFSGTQATGSSELGDIAWGSGVNSDDLLTAIKADERFALGTPAANIFASASTADDVAKILAANSSVAKAFANVAAANLASTATDIAAAATSVDLAAGYYLIVDASTLASNSQDAYNSALLQITGKENLTIDKKYDVPSFDKDIIDNGVNVEAADYNIGDTITYELTGTLPDNYDDYETYKYVFHDQYLSKGQAFQNDVRVYVDSVAAANEITPTSVMPTAKTDGTNQTEITITFDDLKGITKITKTSKIIVRYTAVLTADANIGSAGNKNEAYLEFSNNPNHTGAGTPSTGETPHDYTLVFTYELDVEKVDGDSTSTKLGGAQFVLKATSGEHSGKYVKLDANGKISGWLDNKPSEVQEGTTATTAAANGVLITNESTGLVNIKGLDAGTYELEEIKAPAGYNKLSAPITLTVTATLTGTDTSSHDTVTPALTALTIKVGDKAATNENETTGVVTTQIENNKGATLPTTGGIGTTIFYVLGSILVLGAVILLATRRRMSR